MRPVSFPPPQHPALALEPIAKRVRRAHRATQPLDGTVERRVGGERSRARRTPSKVMPEPSWLADWRLTVEKQSVELLLHDLALSRTAQRRAHDCDLRGAWSMDAH